MFLHDAVSAGASSQEVADVVVAAVQGIDEALKSIIGERGVAALHKRSVHLTRQTYAWMPLSPEAIPVATDFDALTAGLAQQTAADAASAGAELLQTFLDLLNSLIGASLTERLLRPVWANFFSGPSARDTTP